MRLSSCGIDCDTCEIGKEKTCVGCQSVKGKPFWSAEGVCDLFSCASKKEHPHCGKCEGFPCEMLKEWAVAKNWWKANGAMVCAQKETGPTLSADPAYEGQTIDIGNIRYYTSKIKSP